MSFPFLPADQKMTFDYLTGYIRQIFKGLPDNRKGGGDPTYTMEDAALGAFSIFFMQSPSFLEFQRTMKLQNGRSNANTLFRMSNIPSDGQIRNLMDGVLPSCLFPIYEYIINTLYKYGYLEQYRSINGTLLMPFDGTEFFSSKNISCENCTVKEHSKGNFTFSHTVVTPIIAAPGNNKVFPLPPEFVVPQDGHDKQDCETAATKRWLNEYGSSYRDWRITMLGDDLYSRQPTCEAILSTGFDFILVCKPKSHKTLYECVKILETTGHIRTITVHRHIGKRVEIDTYHYVNKVPLRNTDDALMVNWCELTTRDTNGKILYHNAFVTNHEITDENVEEMILAGRTRWKVENENNNNLKTKGYHLTHNFGHGKKHLSTTLATLNILAYLVHTVLDLMDTKYQLVRQKLGTRKNFFNDIRAITRYECMDSWNALLLYMMRGLEIEIPDTG